MPTQTKSLRYGNNDLEPQLQPEAIGCFNWANCMKIKRVADEESAAKEAEDMKAYEQTLTEEQRRAAYEFVDVVKKRIAEVEQASREGRRIGRSAQDFLREL